MRAKRVTRTHFGVLAAVIGAMIFSTAWVSSVVTADPGLIKVGSTYYEASTGSATIGSGTAAHTGILPIYTSTDLRSWTGVSQVFRSGQTPAWADASKGLWAPQIYSIGGQYVAYFSAVDASSGRRCIGIATASSLDDATSFTSRTEFCSPNPYDLIDPSVFIDGSNKYLLYKRDKPVPDKDIAITTLSSDGLTPSVGNAIGIATATQAWETAGGAVDSCAAGASVDGWASVEAPTMIRHGAFYFLFYSGNGYCTDHYGVGVGRCVISAVNSDPLACNFDSDSPRNNGWKYSGNPILTADFDPSHCGAGHQDVLPDGSAMVYHTYNGSQNATPCTGHRYLGEQSLTWTQSTDPHQADWPLPSDSRNP